MTQFYSNAQIFNGQTLLNQHSLVVKDGVAIDIIPNQQLPKDATITRLDGKILSPGYIEVQANGGGGVLFNDAPNIEGLKTILQAHRQFGTVAMLPTFITDSEDKMALALQAIAEGLEQNLQGLIGGHFEGPFINIDKKGAHLAQFIRKPNNKDLSLFQKYNLGNSQVTLAPENVPQEFIHALVKAGLKVSAGHSMANKNDMICAYNQGLSGITHLYNAMPALQGRDPAIIGSAIVLNLFCGIIVDGIHSDPFSLQTAYKSIGADRLMLVTDSMHTIGAPHIKEFTLVDQKVFVKEDRLVTENGSLAGAHISMEQTVKNAVSLMQASISDALKMVTSTPAQFINRPDLARIINRKTADILVLDSQLNIQGFLSQI